MKLAACPNHIETSSCCRTPRPAQNTHLHGSALGKHTVQSRVAAREFAKPLRPRDFRVNREKAATCTASLVLAIRSRKQRRRQSCLHAVRGDAATSAESDRIIEELRDTVRRLEAETRQLKEKLAQSRFDDDVPTAALEPGRGAHDDWPFRYPTADLPWPVESVRVAAPGESTATKPSGDWLPFFRSAAPYIAAYQGGIVVVHVPSNMLDDEEQEAFKGLMEDLAFCSLLGMRLVVVTSIMTRLCRRLGMTRCPGNETFSHQPTMVIDEERLRIVKQEAGLARVEVEGALSAGFEKRNTSGMGGAGAPASHGTFSLKGSVSVVSSANFFTASPVGVRNGVDYQYAGVVRSVNVDVLERRLSDGDIVSLTPLGTSPSGEVFFVDSGHLAARVASKLRAIKLVYITQGARLIDIRSGRIIPGVQKHNVKDLLQHLEKGALATEYSEVVQSSEWFQDFLRHLRFLVDVVSPTGVRRGHLVDPKPGALLQEFYTTDGSGTVIAQDLYQGLGCAQVADAGRIMKLLEEDAERGGFPNVVSLDFVEGSCARGEFFVWKRDGTVLGCGRLAPVWTQAAAAPRASKTSDAGQQIESIPPIDSSLFAELHCMAIAEDCFDTHATAFFGYAERAALAGRASALLASPGPDAKRLTWLKGRGFRQLTASELESLPPTCQTKDGILLMPLDESSVLDADAYLIDFAEQQRMWGGLA